VGGRRFQDELSNGRAQIRIDRRLAILGSALVNASTSTTAAHGSHGSRVGLDLAIAAIEDTHERFAQFIT
jgi:hypothetical protein